MKYLKLFENFNEPDLEDAKWIIISHLGEVKEMEIDPKWNTNDILRLNLEETPTEEQIEKCKAHLEEEGYLLNINGNRCVTGIGNSIKEYCINWLNKNYTGLEKVESKDFPGNFLFRYKVGENILFYDTRTDIVYIHYDKIWSFFKYYIHLELEEIQEIAQYWLSETYNLSGITPNLYYESDTYLLSETYNLNL